MGGNALKKYGVKRLNQNDFFSSFEDISSKLRSENYNFKLEMVPAYKEKESFGDLDIIVSKEIFLNYIDNEFKNVSFKNDEDEINAKSKFLDELFNKEFRSRDMRLNIPVISFEYRKTKEEKKGFQVDLILIPEKFFDFSLNYFSYNDLGNLLGVMYRNLGLKFGGYGLNYELYLNETNKFGEMLITSDFDIALDILELDKDKFKKGFNNLIEIFEYVTSSPYFNKNIYLLDKGKANYKTRRRNAVRGTYKEFLNWISDKDFENNYHYEKSEEGKLKNLNNILGDDFINKRSKRYEEQIKKMENKEKIDGEIISVWTGLTHQALGYLINNFKNKFESVQDLESYLYKTEKNVIKKEFLKLKETLDFSGMMGDPKTNPARMSVAKSKNKK